MSADIHTMTGAYAVDALTEDERHRFESHLIECSACRMEVDEFRRTSAQLGAAMYEPAPASLRASVLDRIDVTRQERPTNVVSIHRPRTSRAQKLVAVAAAVFAITTATLGTIVSTQSGRIDNLETAMVRSTDVVVASDAQTLRFAGPDGVIATAVYSPNRGEGVFLANGLEAAPSGMVYELWLLGADGTATPAGLFNAGTDGRVLPHLLTGDMRDVSAFAVTLEPAGGSPQPTSDPIIVVS